MLIPPCDAIMISRIVAAVILAGAAVGTLFGNAIIGAVVALGALMVVYAMALVVAMFAFDIK
jgi:hypothetical protein